MRKSRLLFLSLLIFACSCRTGTLFDEVGTHLAAPISVAVDPANLRAYVVNSNFHLAYSDTTLSILDISNPASPTLLSSSVNPISIPDFSGQIYFDPATRLATVTNRLSENSQDNTDALLRINLDESSASFGTVESFNGGENPFGIACCDASGRLYVATAGKTLNVFDPSNLSTAIQLSLEATLSTGEKVSGANSTSVVILGNQAFVTNLSGRIYVINTTEVGDTSKNPIDTLILNGTNFRGIATDGTLLYVVEGDSAAEVLRIINPASLTAVAPDTSAISEVDVGTIQTAAVPVGNNPNEVVVFKGKAYVTNLDDDTVTVINLSDNSVSATISVGDEPFGMSAFTIAGTDYLYVTNLASNSVSVIDLASNAVLSTFAP